MKKWLVLGMIAWSVNANAQPNDIYCPQEIVCDASGRVEGCVSHGGSSKIFNQIPSDGVSRLVSGAYSFFEATSTYDTKDEAKSYRLGVYCRYHNYAKGFKKQLVITPLRSDNFYYEAAYSPDSKWIIDDYLATCKSSNPQDCPLHMVQQ